MWCRHCNKPRHTKGTYLKLQWKPTKLKITDPKERIVQASKLLDKSTTPQSGVSESQLFTKEHLEQPHKRFNQLQSLSL